MHSTIESNSSCFVLCNLTFSDIFSALTSSCGGRLEEVPALQFSVHQTGDDEGQNDSSHCTTWNCQSQHPVCSLQDQDGNCAGYLAKYEQKSLCGCKSVCRKICWIFTLWVVWWMALLDTHLKIVSSALNICLNRLKIWNYFYCGLFCMFVFVQHLFWKSLD